MVVTQASVEASELKTSVFDYHLPSHLIAAEPVINRTDSRLLHLPYRGELSHYHFKDLVDLFQPGDLLVLNDSKVMKARLLGHKATGGQVEVLVEKVVNAHQAWCHVRSNRSPKLGTVVKIADCDLTLRQRQDRLFLFDFSSDVFELMAHHGHVPLPPYINRPDNAQDVERYQTVYACQLGSVAAPTAGLHFDQILLDQLKAKGVKVATLTLHVGAGTFLPVQTENILDHIMHQEWIDVSANLVSDIEEVKNSGGRVIACGTTSVRALETAALSGQLKPYSGNTDIFIYPGVEMRVIDGLITNFHLPKSSLVMLVSALVGQDRLMMAYQAAIQANYRFYSYGDAMVIL